MRASLSDSLAYLHSVIRSRAGLSDDVFEAANKTLKSRRVIPGVFGRYYKLVMAVQGGADEDARRLFRELIDAINQPPSFRVEIFSDAGLGAEKALYDELLNPPDKLPWLCPLQADDGVGERVNEALGLLAIACPELAEEMRSIVLQIVAASPSHEPGGQGFGSVSSFMLWGLIIFNAERHRTAAALAPCLVHEAAHQLLFAHAIEEPLVLNDINARYKSPLRKDARPMDGVYHATFVVARMYYAVQKLREAALAGTVPLPVSDLDKQSAGYRDLFFSGLQTVREFGELTETGRRIMDETADYMQAN